MNTVELLYKCNNILGEGITWSSATNNIYWVDIGNKSKIYNFDFNKNSCEFFEIPEIITATSIRSDKELILASNNGLNIFDMDTKKFARILDVENTIHNTRSNDGASDVMGRFWFGTMQNNFDLNGNDIPIKDFVGKLYKIDIDKQITIVEEGLGIPNTFVWSPDNKKFYFTDTLKGNIISYQYDLHAGQLSNKKHFANFDRGFPDGSTIDTEGCLWNCRWGGSCIVRFTPTGKVDQVLEMPVQNITNCIFGGSDMKTLFITTASNKGENKNDLDGSLFAINLNYQGLEDNKSKIELS